MSEWWSYGLSDFLMFSPETYWRLVARFNARWWPWQWLGAMAALALPLLLASRRGAARRTALALLALAWAWVAWAFHARAHAEIFLGAPWLAGAGALQALLLLLATAALHLPERLSWTAHAGLGLCALASAYPLLGPLTGHPWREAEVFGFLPEPTALATVGALLALGPRRRGLRVLLAIVPVLSLAIGGATRWLLRT